MHIKIEEDHIYKVDGIVKVGTNQVLDLYFPPSPFYTEEGKDAGKARHLWFDFLSRGQEPNEDADPRIAGHVQAFRSWLSDVKPERHGGEICLYDQPLDVCGTPDWFGLINGVLSVVDYKPETRNKRTPLQTAAYKHNLRANGINVVNRYELRTSNEGRCRFEKHEDVADENRWIALIYGYHAATHYR